MLEKILARACYKLEWKRVGLGVLVGFFVVMISLCTVIRSQMYALPIYPQERFESLLAPLCNFSGDKSDFCELDGDIRILGNSSYIAFNSPQLAYNVSGNNSSTWSIKLYARKTDEYVMRKVKNFRLKPVTSHDHDMPKCTVNHSLPAIVFSTGGYAGNIFHDMTDVLIPLYLTSLPFNGEVQLLVQEQHSWWNKRHEVMLKALSNYRIIDLDRDKEVRCFNNAIVGLKSHKDFGIDPNKVPYGLTLRSFTHFTRKIYSLKRKEVHKISVNRKPRLLIISRKKTRIILNENELVNEAQNIGYDVMIIDAMMSQKKFSKIVNSVDVMIGVHGAGLTNIVYLPQNAILIQVVPLGLDSISRIFFERPARDMNLKYLEYKVNVNESSLIQQYPSKHQIITNPNVIEKQGWNKFKSIYLDNQDITLDMNRFKIVLLKALEFLHQYKA